MESWKKELYENELYHHGILGMKWGVRRYQNKDGSYTRKGLERYRRSEKAYRDAESNLQKLKENGASKAELKEAKKTKRQAKKDLSDDYDRLKQDNLADQGKALYAKGKTITDNSSKLKTFMTVSSVVDGAVYIGLKASGMEVATKFGNVPLAELSSVGIGLGAAVVGGAMSVKNRKEAKRLRAYYAHQSAPSRKNTDKQAGTLNKRQEAALDKYLDALDDGKESDFDLEALLEELDKNS